MLDCTDRKATSDIAHVMYARVSALLLHPVSHDWLMVQIYISMRSCLGRRIFTLYVSMDLGLLSTQVPILHLVRFSIAHERYFLSSRCLAAECQPISHAAAVLDCLQMTVSLATLLSLSIASLPL